MTIKFQKGGGICTYLRQGLSLNNLPDLSCCDNNIEMSAINYNLPHTRPIFVFNIYRPPSGDIAQFFKVLQQEIDTLRTRDKLDIFIGGDFNIDIKHKNIYNYSKLFEIFENESI